ncbi:MAG: caspase family protein [Syntrophobacterales bacterium]|nr:caspase family protein [Syntrophobacterales bacterium]
MNKYWRFPLLAFLAAVAIFLVPSAAFGESVTGKVSVFPQTAAAVSDLKGPEIVITRPEVKRGVTVKAREEAVVVAGRATDPSGVASVVVNGRPAALDENGEFTAEVLLKVGSNQIVVAATDTQKNTTTRRFTIQREKTKLAAKKQAAPAADAAPPAASSGGEAALAAGRSYALLIGINAYRGDVGRLQTAVADARAVAQVLKDDYGFQTTLLLDAQATRGNILKNLDRFKKSLNPEDRFLLYYAGHGWHDRETETSYWLPAEAEKTNTVDWIMSKQVTDELRRMRARQVMVVADSCYAGTIDRAFNPEIAAEGTREVYLRKMQEKPSRVLIASGGAEPVTDSGGGGHSIFAAVLLRALKAPGQPSFTAQELFAGQIREAVAGRSEQTPEYKTIRASGHDGGDFVFIRRR